MEIHRNYDDAVRVSSTFNFIVSPALVRKVFRNGNVQMKVDALSRSFSEDDIELWFNFKKSRATDFSKSKAEGFRDSVQQVISERPPQSVISCLDYFQILMSTLTTLYLFGEVPGDTPLLVKESVSLVVERHSSLKTVGMPFWVPTKLNLRTRLAKRKLRQSLRKTVTKMSDKPLDHATTTKLVKLFEAVIAAGTMPPASVMSWTFHLLEEHPKVESELHILIGSNPSKAREFMLTIITEAMRLYPPNLLIRSSLLRDVEAEGFSFKKGSTVAYSPYFIHRDSKFWSDPEQFVVTRENSLKKEAYLPFGVGPNTCLGSHLAKVLLTEVGLELAAGYIFRKSGTAVSRPRELSSLVIPENMTMEVKDRCPN